MAIFSDILIYLAVAIFCSVLVGKPSTRKVTSLIQTSAIPTLAIQVGVFPHSYAFHSVFSHNQKNGMST
jgi:hypothetical protein